MKLNLSTPPESVINTLKEEYKQANDAYIKSHGGLEALDKWQEELLVQISKRKEGFIADKFFWVSPSGNKWCVFQNCEYDYLYPHTNTLSFCYYETQGFGGIFLHIFAKDLIDGKKKDGVVIYESHFFERCHERDVYEWKGIDTLVEFVSKNKCITTYSINKEERRIDVRFDKCIGRGFFDKKLGTSFIKIKSVLSDEQLTKRQRRQTSAGRGMCDVLNKYVSETQEDSHNKFLSRTVNAIDNNKTAEFMDELKRDFMRVTGANEDEAELHFAFIASVQEIVLGIYPSLTKKILSCSSNTDINEDAIQATKDWFELQDEKLFENQLYNAAIKLAKMHEKNLTLQSIRKFVYKKMLLNKFNEMYDKNPTVSRMMKNLRRKIKSI